MDRSLEELEIRLLLEAIYCHYGYDFRDYARASLLRRIRHRIALSGLECISDLQKKILHDPVFFDVFLRDLSVSVTEMFRDPFVYQHMRNAIIPMLKTYPFIKIWCAGCATGEETYSLALMLYEEGFLDKTYLYATDFNKHSLAIAHEGIYNTKIIETAEKNYIKSGGRAQFRDYFISKYDSFKIKNHIKEQITFSHHNLVMDGVFGEMHLIICRNVMIYFNETLQQKVFTLFNNSLIHHGYLCLGTKETLELSPLMSQYEIADKKARIYRKTSLSRSSRNESIT